MKICDGIKKQLASLEFSELESIDDKNLQAHIEQCVDCQAYYQSCKNLNQAIEQLPEYDASDELVARTLQRVLNEEKPQSDSNSDTQKSKLGINPKWASGLAAGFVVVSLIGLMPEIMEPEFSSTAYNYIGSSPKESYAYEGAEKNGIAVDDSAPVVEEPEQKYLLGDDKTAALDTKPVDKIEANLTNRSDTLRIKNNETPASSSEPSLSQGFIVESELSESDGDGVQSYGRTENQHKLSVSKASKKTRSLFADSTTEQEREQTITEENVIVTGGRIKSSPVPTSQKDQHYRLRRTSKADETVTLEKRFMDGFSNTNENQKLSRDVLSFNESIGDEVFEQKQQPLLGLSNESLDRQDFRKEVSVDDSPILLEKVAKLEQGSVAPPRKNATVKYKGKKEAKITGSFSLETKISEKNISTNIAKQFLTSIQSLDNLIFQNPTGYWANTYVPGDSNIRWIENQLQNWDRSSINYTLGNDFNIDALVKQNHQPFDYPNASALTVYLQSDHKAIRGPTRMRVQVGLQASERQSGQRSAMNIGLIFDLQNKTTLAPKMRALLFALLKSKQPGDKISLTVTGASGGMLIDPENFRHGPIKILLNKMLSEKIVSPDPKHLEPQYLKLKNALIKTGEWLQQNDDPTASLGSSVILLVTDKKIGNNLPEIESILHQNATKGITFSSVSLNGKTEQEELDRLVLAGQGHNRVLQSEDDAQRIINEELFASSRAVARAIRLKIRLAKGVQLINVLDSYNLNEIQSQRVRDAEKSIDQRLSKNLGIIADRGEDEEGIQIVIPSFFAGDTHVILLDVLVNNPGAVADVSVRYKDLLYLKNSIVREHLSIETGEKPIGHLELNVLKNLLANRFSQAIKKSSQLIRAGNIPQAIAKLNSIQQLYQGIRTEIPAWHDDNEMIADELLVSQSIQILNSNILADETQRLLIADSLYYTSWRKLISENQ